MKKVLTIAGSDSGGCAGIQADLKTMSACNVFGMTVITAVTSQNTLGVSYIENMSLKSIETQLEAIYNDLSPDALKSGMLSTKEIILLVADFLKKNNRAPYVLDPVIVSTSGSKLLEDTAIDSLIEKLIHLAQLITPNLAEAEVLSNMKLSTMDDIKIAAKKIRALGAEAVLIKGGHLQGATACDTLYVNDSFIEFSSEMVPTKNTHGTGCTYSAAIASFLAKGYSLEEAVRLSKDYITRAIKKGATMELGKGAGPVCHQV